MEWMIIASEAYKKAYSMNIPVSDNMVKKLYDIIQDWHAGVCQEEQLKNEENTEY